MLKRLVVLSALSFGCPGISFAQSVAYVWTGEDGASRVSDTIPSESLHRGYKVVNAKTGRFIREVPPSDVEARTRDEARAVEAEKLAEKENQKPGVSVDGALKPDPASASDLAESTEPVAELESESEIGSHEASEDARPDLDVAEVDKQIEQVRERIRAVMEGTSDERLDQLQTQMTALYRMKAEAGYL